jgi:hypothetical protein
MIEFLKVRKKFWLLPVLTVSILFLLGLLVVTSQVTAVASFIYTIF